jgi:hypothetical protein
MVALRSPRRPPAPPEVVVEPPPAPVAEQPTAVPAPPDAAPMLDVLEAARDSTPLPQSGPDVSVLQAQIAAQKQAELVQQQAFEAQRQIAAQMAIEKTPKQEPPQLSERDLEFLGARPGIQSDPSFNQSVAALAHVYKYGSDDFYKAMELKYPVSDFRRLEPKHQEDRPDAPAFMETKMEEKPAQRRVVVSAPVSRSGQPSGGDYSPSPSRVKLSAAERQIAAQSGLTDAQYAEQKIKMERLKASGFYREE